MATMALRGLSSLLVNDIVGGGHSYERFLGNCIYAIMQMNGLPEVSVQSRVFQFSPVLALPVPYCK